MLRGFMIRLRSSFRVQRAHHTFIFIYLFIYLFFIDLQTINIGKTKQNITRKIEMLQHNTYTSFSLHS